MRPLLSIALLSLLAAPASGAPTPETTTAAARKVEAVRTTAPIRVDGELSEDCWQAAPVAGDFWQHSPVEGGAPEFATEFRVAYDDDALYVAIRAHDHEPDKIRARLTRRDEDSSSDWVFVGVDSYHDRRTAFIFGINPAGVQRDMIRYDDTEEDDSWNAVWEGAARIGPGGWSAEMRIPYSQLRFTEQPEQTWGLQVARVVQRTNETSFWNPVPRDKPQFVSLFGEVHGIREIRPARRLEVVPYVVGGPRFAPVDPDDPFADRLSGTGSFGLDARYGLTSNLTLSATINPDFGQVEADPSQVNLTAQESFFAEKRPFFLEGADILRFGLGQGDGDGSVETLFYSRRIGAAPHGTGYDYGDYAHQDSSTSIYGATKLSGKTRGGWSIGVMNAVTAEERSIVAAGDGQRITPVIEPLTSYSVGKVSRDYNGGRSKLSAAVTAVHRDLDGTELDWLRTSAYAGGASIGHRWADSAWSADLRLAGSAVQGSTVAIDETQRASQRYFQRPDADHLDYDPNRTSLHGAGALGSITRSGKRWQGAVGFDTRSPGFEVNDLGFQRGADYITTWAWQQIRDTERGDYLQDYSINFNAWNVHNFGGEHLNVGGNVNGNVTLKSYWGANAGIMAGWDRLQTGHLRGGPAVRGNRFVNSWQNLWTDPRKAVRGSLGIHVGAAPASDSWWTGGGAEVIVHPRENLELSVGPSWNVSVDDNQYVEESVDADGQPHYVQARIRQTVLGATVRFNYTASPTLSVQVYAQPFVAAGSYTEYKETVDPRAARYADRHHTFRPDELMDGPDRIVMVDRADGSGSFVFTRPDFNFRELRSNVVVRWEYMPGSTLFFIWSQGRSDVVEDGRFRVGHDLRELARADGEHVLLAKLTFWFGL